MRKCVQYPADLKETLLAKAFSPNPPSILELARKSGVPYPTLYTWVRMKKNGKRMSNVPARPQDQTAEAKLQEVFNTFHMSDEERAAYCRKHGLYTHHLDDWKHQILMGLKPISGKENKAEYRHMAVEIKKLQKELNRKERALLEASALLLLKKKANLIWGDGEDDQ